MNSDVLKDNVKQTKVDGFLVFDKENLKRRDQGRNSPFRKLDFPEVDVSLYYLSRIIFFRLHCKLSSVQ